MELPPSWFVKASAIWGECLNYRGEGSGVGRRLDPKDLKPYTEKSTTELSFVKVSEDLKHYRSAFFHADFGLF